MKLRFNGMAQPALCKQLPDGRWQFRTEAGAYYHITADHLCGMLDDVEEEMSIRTNTMGDKH